MRPETLKVITLAQVEALADEQHLLHEFQVAFEKALTGKDLVLAREVTKHLSQHVFSQSKRKELNADMIDDVFENMLKAKNNFAVQILLCNPEIFSHLAKNKDYHDGLLAFTKMQIQALRETKENLSQQNKQAKVPQDQLHLFAAMLNLLSKVSSSPSDHGEDKAFLRKILEPTQPVPGKFFKSKKNDFDTLEALLGESPNPKKPKRGR